MINVLVTTTYGRQDGCAITTTLIPARTQYEAKLIADKINHDNKWSEYAGYGQYALIVGHSGPEDTEQQ